MNKKTKKIKDLRGTFFSHENCKRHLNAGTNENYNWYRNYNIFEIIKEKEKFIKSIQEDKLRLVELEDKLKLPENWWFKHKNVYLDIDDLTVEIECQEIDLKIIEQEISKRYYEQNNSLELSIYYYQNLIKETELRILSLSDDTLIIKLRSEIENVKLLLQKNIEKINE